MENGVEKPILEQVTKTADGAVAQFKLVDKVVQVFHDDKAEEEPEPVPEPPSVSEDETRTADGAVSQLELVDNVVTVYHQQKDSEGDDVFEEAMADDNLASEEVHHPELTDSEVNGLASGGVTEAETFEEAVDTELPVEDRNVVEDNFETGGAGDEVRVADGVVNLNDVLSEEFPNGVVCNGEGDEKEAEVDGVESSVKFDAGVEDKVIDDDDDNRRELRTEEESPDGVVCNAEEDENQSFASIANGEAKPSTDAEVESNEKSDNADLTKSKSEDKSDNGHLTPSESEEKSDNVNLTKLESEENSDTEELTKSESEEKPDILANSSDVVHPISGDISLSNGNESGDQNLSEDDQCKSNSSDAAVHEVTENGMLAEDGGLEKSELEEKPAVLAKNSDVDEVGSDEIVLSERNEKIVSQESDQNLEIRDTVPTLEAFPNEQIQTPETKIVPEDIGLSVDGGTDMKEEHPDTDIDKMVSIGAAELKENHSPNVQAQSTGDNLEEGSANHAAVKEPELQETQVELKKPDTPSIEEARDSSSARKPEIQTAAEQVQVAPRRPAGLGGAAPLFDPTPRAPQQPRVNGTAAQRQAQLVEDPMNGETEENDETREKLQMIRVKFLRLAHRLGQTPHNVVVAQVLYRLGLAEQLRGRNAGRVGAFSFDRASAMAEQLESAGQEPLDFSCTIMVLGKTGVGKSATINSIFDEIKFGTDAFQVGTKKVQDVVGTVQGIKVRVIDTPGLLPCWSDQRQNEKILHSVKRFIKKTPPDIVLYFDRLDMQTRDFGDLPLLRTITEIFGPSIWFNAIVVLTHAASAPPDGPNGISSSYEMFVTQRSHVVQQAIRQAAGDMRLMNPVSLVENHSACRTNRAGQRVLPNGQVWKPHLLLLSFASKILAEANTLLKLQDNPPGKPFATRPRVPPLPFLLSSLLQSRPQVKLPEEQFGDDDDLDEDLDESSDSEDESEYDELPPFKRLTKAQLAKLSKAQKKAYFDELEYREKLYMKKQLREERKRRKLLKKMAASAKEVPSDYSESAEEESGGGASVPVAMPDFSLPASFDSDNPSHRYRFLDTSNPWLVRPVLETHGWDHDVGYEGINVERLFVVKDKIPVSFSGQATKDKKESNLQMELASSIKHNEGKATSVGFDMQTIGKDMSYTLRSETRFSNFRQNKTAAGLSVTLLGDAITAGLKLEDRLNVSKRFRLVLTGGAMTGRGDVAYGGSLEATLRDKDHPLGRTLSTLGLSVMDWHGDLAIGCNVQSQIPIGRSSNLIARANLNNRGSGQVTIRLNSSEQLQIALVGLLPLFRKAISLYQQTVYGE